jgi:predicted house-cleaning noncanonical NTP pyrophosphatase (MazG superfamily)
MKLPFLEGSKWPISREPGERTVNPSYDKQLESHLMDEIMEALEHKDASKLRESIVALIEHINSSEDSDGA